MLAGKGPSQGDDTSVKDHMDPSVWLITPDAPWTEDVREQLTACGLTTQTLTRLEDAQPPLAQPALGAILAAATPDNVHTFAALREQMGPRTPLLILIAESEPEAYPVADSVLPPQARLIAQQLALLLRLKRENERLATELEAARKSTNEIELLKNAIVRNVSHELRTPLLQVKSSVAMLREDVEDTKLVSYAENATARLEGVVKNIALLGNSLDQVKPGPVILRDAFEYARRQVKRSWQNRDRSDRLHFHPDGDIAPVLADKQGLSTVLQLLFDNALKFSEGPVELQARRDGDEIVIAVKDQGIGIAETELSHIFDTFYQIDPNSTRRYGGTGVGLALVKIILEHHNSTIDVSSQVGQGSVFSFRLPVIKVEPPHNPPAPIAKGRR